MLYEKYDDEDRTSGVTKEVFETEEGVIVETRIIRDYPVGHERVFPTSETFSDTLENVIADLVADGFKKARIVVGAEEPEEGVE